MASRYTFAMDPPGEVNMALHKAVIDGMSDVVVAILHRGTDPNQRDEETGKTAVHCAARASNLQMLQLLKEYKADMSMVDYRSNTPLSEAVETGNVSVVQWFLENLPQNKNVVTDMLSLAAAFGQVKVMSTLLAQGATIEEKDELGRNALFHAADNGQSEAVLYLIKQGANPAVCDDYKKTLLHAAADSGDLKTIELVFKHCPDMMQDRDDSGDTPLHCAVATNRAAVALLLDRGAPFDLRNRKGYTPLELAKKAKKTEIVDLLHDVIYQFDELNKRILNL